MANLSITLPSCSTPAIAERTTAPATGPNYNAHPSYVMRNLSPIRVSQLFTRASQATLEIDGVYRLVGVNKIRFDVNTNAYLIEPASTNYFIQDYVISCAYVTNTGIYVIAGTGYVVTDSGEYVIVSAEPPATQTITLPTTGPYTLWVNGSATATISVVSGGVTLNSTIARDNAYAPWIAGISRVGIDPAGGDASAHITVTSAPAVVTVTITGAVNGDEVQLEASPWRTSYIPNNSTSGTTRAADLLYAPEV